MLANLPDETTQLLIDLCTMPASASLYDEPEDEEASRTRSGPSYLSYLALNRNSVAEIANVPASLVQAVKQTTDPADDSNNTSRPDTPPTAKPPILEPVTRLSPRLYFAHFVDHMDQFVLFLETVAKRRWGQSVDSSVDVQPPLEPTADQKADREDQVAVWNTLLELYLTLGRDAEAVRFRAKAMHVLQSAKIPYDPTHALILCSSRGYTPGLVLLWERMGMYEDVLRFWMDKDKEGSDPEASGQVVKHLKAYGDVHPHLYPLVLRFLTSSSDLLARHQEDVRDVLEHINKENIMPPLGVIQVLSRNNVASIGLVKEWMMTRIREARDEIQAVSSLQLEGGLS